jgi:hypothetical protein
MPDPNSVSAGYNQGHIDLSAAPGSDQDWDSLFPNPELQSASQPQVASGTQPQQQPQATQNQPFLKAGETVYNTAEDAAAGVAHKDSVIAKYRDFLAQNGLDPNAVLKNEVQTIQRPQAQQEPAKPSQYKYYGNPNFFDEVADAAAKRDRARYEQLMSAHSREAANAAIQEVLAPWQTTLAETNRFRAIRQATTEVPEFQKFIEGPGYKKVLDTFPLYKEMVQIGENDPVAAQRLPEVYKSMYLIYQGMNQGQTVPPGTNATPQNPPTVRSQPTLQHSSLTPPPPSSSTQGWQEASWRGNKAVANDARKQLIQDGDNRFNGMKFEDVGL